MLSGVEGGMLGDGNQWSRLPSRLLPEGSRSMGRGGHLQEADWLPWRPRGRWGTLRLMISVNISELRSQEGKEKEEAMPRTSDP